MSLNFFKHKSVKTDASLKYNTVADVLNTLDVTNGSLNIDTFLQSESVNLQRHRELFNKDENPVNIPEKLEEDKEYTATDIRAFVQSLNELTKRMPEAKGTATEYKEKVEKLSQVNNQTIDDIHAVEKNFLMNC
ncbi:hypothetical protein BDF20DRAFT_910935 [Mycotypha africana]|uniref:uncharacterized protein n=1 Tax=Mycotypha africana TaxID=64632 RepID=UPI0023001A27|nr:uncharacterized protein BDF20DRAFT_910935 [Mycotypha africana]KAI8988457.1 hypothetical protein BDF20DRAFT_910935 [Mycotypha africana]